MDEIKVLQEENVRLSQELKDKAFELSVLYEITNNISYTLDYDGFLQLLIESVHKIINYDVCTSILVLEEEKKVRMVMRLAHPVQKCIVEELKARVIKSFNSIRGVPILEEHIEFQYKGDLLGDNETSAGLIKTSFDVPLFVQDVAVGLLNIASFQEIPYSDDKIRLFYTLASQASATIERLRAILSAEKSKMNTMVERMSEGVIMLDEKDQLVILNAVARDILGYYEQTLDAGALIKHFQDLLVIDSFDQIKKGNNAQFIKEFYVDNPFPRIIHMEAVYMQDVARKPLGMAMVLRDVTKEKEIEQMKNEFVSLVSHELRTPLAAMKGATENMLDGITGEINALQNDCLVIIKRNIDRLGRLISDLLDISRIEAGKIQLNKQRVEVPAIINDVLNLLKDTAKEKKINLEVFFDTGLPQLEIDPDKINQVITNLVGNAIKFTPAEGKIKVEVLKLPENIQVNVVDSGIGIPLKDLEKVFDKFYQVSRPDAHTKARGTGLGLPISKGIIEKHGGKIWVESEINKGSIFCFTLPLTKEG